MGTCGVPLNLDREQLIKSIQNCGGRLTYVARELNCCYRSLKKYISKHEELASLIDDIRHQRSETLLDKSEDVLESALDGKVDDMGNALKSAFYVLNNKGKNRGYFHPNTPDTQSSTQITPQQIIQTVNDIK